MRFRFFGRRLLSNFKIPENMTVKAKSYLRQRLRSKAERGRLWWMLSRKWKKRWNWSSRSRSTPAKPACFSDVITPPWTSEWYFSRLFIGKINESIHAEDVIGVIFMPETRENSLALCLKFSFFWVGPISFTVPLWCEICPFPLASVERKVHVSEGFRASHSPKERAPSPWIGKGALFTLT